MQEIAVPTAIEVMSTLYCCDCECEMAFWDVVTCVFVLVMLPDYSMWSCCQITLCDAATVRWLFGLLFS